MFAALVAWVQGFQVFELPCENERGFRVAVGLYIRTASTQEFSYKYYMPLGLVGTCNPGGGCFH